MAAPVLTVIDVRVHLLRKSTRVRFFPPASEQRRQQQQSGSPVAATGSRSLVKTAVRQQPSKCANKVSGWSRCLCCFSGERNDAANKVSATLGQTSGSLAR